MLSIWLDVSLNYVKDHRNDVGRGEEQSHQMEILCVGVPSIMNNVRDSLGLKDVKLFRFLT